MEGKKTPKQQKKTIFGALNPLSNSRTRRKNKRLGDNASKAQSKYKKKNGFTQDRTPEKKRARTDYPVGAIPEIVTPNKEHLAPVSDLSKEKIDNVLTAIYDEQNKQTVSFDEAISLVKSRAELAEDEDIIYAGKGTFAVVAYEKIDNKQKQVVRRKIDFEKHQDALEWRDTLRYGLSLAYKPNPDSLSDLYTLEEISQFPLRKR